MSQLLGDGLWIHYDEKNSENANLAALLQSHAKDPGANVATGDNEKMALPAGMSLGTFIKDRKIAHSALTGFKTEFSKSFNTNNQALQQ